MNKIILMLKYFEKIFNLFFKLYVSLLFIIFVWLVVLGFNMIFFTNSLNISDTLVLTIAILGIDIALAAMVFTYTSVFDDKERRNSLIATGEKFVISAVAFLANLGLIGFSKIGYFDDLFNKASNKENIFKFLFIIILLSSIVAFIYFFIGIWKLISFIFRKSYNGKNSTSLTQ